MAELQAAVKLADNQIFRMKFIDPKMPGYVRHPEQIEVSKAAFQVLQDALNNARDKGL